jgi:hypothetical protein
VIVSIAAIVGLLFADGIARRFGGWTRGSATAARVRFASLVCAVAILLVGPAIWSVDTLGHPTSSTFPSGGPESASTMGGPGGGGGPGGMTGAPGGFAPGGVRTSSNMERQSTNAVGELFGEGAGGPPSMGGGMSAGGGGMFGGEDLSSILEYTEAHGGGTIAVDSQSGAAASIIEEGAEVAGIGGFSGKESSVSAEWLEERIESGAIRWIYTSGSSVGFGGAGGTGGDTRTGSESAIDTVVKSCAPVDASAYESAGAESGPGESSPSETTGSGSSGGTLYQCSDS